VIVVPVTVSVPLTRRLACIGRHDRAVDHARFRKSLFDLDESVFFLSRIFRCTRVLPPRGSPRESHGDTDL
jgi:hypothetical protein